jgi:hypothetical protein
LGVVEVFAFSVVVLWQTGDPVEGEEQDKKEGFAHLG